MDEKLVADWLKAKLKRELGAKHMRYADLVTRLNELGVDENEVNLRNKMSRGTFSAAFFVECLAAIGVNTLDVDLLHYLATAASAPTLGDVSRADLDVKLSGVRLAFTLQRPQFEFEEVLLPSDGIAKRHLRLRVFACGNCQTPVLKARSIQAVQEIFHGRRAVGRCSTCRAYLDLPGSEVHPA
jgi:Domain of unknown function (DUF6471)